MQRVFNLSSILSLILYTTVSWAGTPTLTTFQTRITLPNGSPLESSSVNFRFTILDSAGTCVIYVEDYNSVNMSSSQGVASFSLGSGTKQYPAGPVAMYEVFNNSTPSYPCQAGGTYVPGTADRRDVIMQFNDGSGWQTLPQIAINSVFYSTYANRAESLGSFTANDFLRPSTLPICTGTQALNYDGNIFTCMTPAGGGGGSVTSVSGTAPISVATGSSTPVISIAKATSSISGYLSSADWTAFNAKANSVVGAGKLYLGNASGDATGVTLSGDATLATNGVMTLANSGVTAGTYGSTSTIPFLTIDSKGRVTSASSGAYQDAAASAKGIVQIGSNIHVSSGTISITSADVTGALGYTPASSAAAGFANGGNAFSADATLGATSNFGLGFITNNVNRMTITNGGKVGIGTTSPGSKFEVVGDINITGNYKVNGVNIGGGTQWVTSSSDISYSAGNVGIGTAGPVASLDVNGDAILRDSLYVLSGSSGTTQLLADIGRTAYGTRFYPDMATVVPLSTVGLAGQTGDLFQARDNSGLTLFNVTAGGNVGVGTTTLNHRLEVAWKTGDTGPTAYFGSSSLSNDQTAIYAQTAGYVPAIYGYSDNGAGVKGNSYAGNGVHGTSYNGSGVVGQSSNGYSGYFVSLYPGTTLPTLVTKTSTGQTGDLFQAQNATGTPMTVISSNGNLGIGSTTPGYPLTVAGNKVAIGTGIMQLGGTGYGEAQVVSLGFGNSIAYDNSIGIGWSNTTGGSDSAISIGVLNSVTGDLGIAIGRNNAVAGQGVSIGNGISNTIVGSIQLGSSDAGKMTLLADGSLGIGTSTPSYKLTVVGDISASGCLRSSAGVASGSCVSDERLKTDIHTFDLGLEALLGIKPKYFRYNGLGEHPASEHLELGVIAQDVEKTAPSLVQKRFVKMHPKDETLTEIRQVNYTALPYVLINAVKELYQKFLGVDQKLDAVTAQNAITEERLRKLEAENAQLKARLEKIEQSLNSK